jgi:hypothetical protein
MRRPKKLAGIASPALLECPSQKPEQPDTAKKGRAHLDCQAVWSPFAHSSQVPKQWPERRDQDQLSHLNAEVEAEQRGHQPVPGEGDLDQDSRESKAVHESEGKGDGDAKTRGPLR